MTSNATKKPLDMSALKTPAAAAPAKAAAKPAAKPATKAATSKKTAAKPAAKPAATKKDVTPKSQAKPAATNPAAKADSVPKADPVPKATTTQGKGNNSGVTLDELIASAKQIGDSLAGVMNADGRAEKAKGQADTLRKEAAATMFPILERLGLDPSWGTEFAKKAKEFPEYERLREEVCAQLSKKVKDKITTKTDKDGNAKPSVFSGRVKKAFSRLVTSYKEGGDGGQTNADKAARENAASKTKVQKQKADMMDHIIIANADGNTDQVEALIKSASGQWGKALGVTNAGK